MAAQFFQGVIGTNYSVSYASSYPANNMPNTNTALAVSAWINAAAFPATPTASMVGLYNGANNASLIPTTGIQMGSGQSGTAGAFDIWTWGGTILVTTAGTPTLPTNQWFNVVYTCTALSGTSQTHSIYINGSLSNSSTNALQTVGTLTQFFLNGYPASNIQLSTYNETTNMLIDDVRIYNRMLSNNEIKTIYTLKGARDSIVSGLVHRYNFTENSSGSLLTNGLDYTQSNNTLVVYNVNGSSFAPVYANGIANLDLRLHIDNKYSIE